MHIRYKSFWALSALTLKCFALRSFWDYIMPKKHSKKTNFEDQLLVLKLDVFLPLRMDPPSQVASTPLTEFSRGIPRSADEPAGLPFLSSSFSQYYSYSK